MREKGIRHRPPRRATWIWAAADVSRPSNLRFYLVTIWICRRADLTPVRAMIFRRRRSLGADSAHHLPQRIAMTSISATATSSA
jgi:hypothetical protein